MASHAILHNSLQGLHALLLVLPALLLALVHEVGLHKGCLADLHECGPDGKHLWEPSSAGKAGECARGLEQWQGLPDASDEDFVAPLLGVVEEALVLAGHGGLQICKKLGENPLFRKGFPEKEGQFSGGKGPILRGNPRKKQRFWGVKDRFWEANGQKIGKSPLSERGFLRKRANFEEDQGLF